MRPVRIPILIFATLLSVGSPAATQALRKPRKLPLRLASILGRAERLGASVSAYVRPAMGSGTALYSYHPRLPRVPASNLKILTAIHALATLGKDAVVKTEFRVNGDAVLSISPSGDPCLADRISSSSAIFDRLAERLRSSGIRSLAGLAFRPEAWPGPSRPKTWPKSQLHTYYSAPTGPYVLEEGCLVADIEAAAEGACRVSFVPAGMRLPVEGRIVSTRSRKKGSRYGLRIDRDGRIRLQGAFYVASPKVRVRIAAQDPLRLYEAALRAALRRAKIECKPGRVPWPEQTGELVYEHESKLRPAIRELLADSSNFQAEQILRLCAAKEGKEASLAAGVALLRARFDPGPERKGELIIVDGSGLSKGNRVSAELLVDALRQAWRAPYNQVFASSLAQSGVSGTLKRRMRGNTRGRVRAKTGWVRGASSLSGFVRTAAGRTLAFSVLMNYDPKRSGLNKKLKAIQDAFVEELYRKP